MKQNLESEVLVIEELKKQNFENNRKLQDQIKQAQQKTSIEIPVAEIEKEDPPVVEEVEPEIQEESENLDEEDDFEDGEVVNDHLEGL